MFLFCVVLACVNLFLRVGSHWRVMPSVGRLREPRWRSREDYRQTVRKILSVLCMSVRPCPLGSGSPQATTASSSSALTHPTSFSSCFIPVLLLTAFFYCPLSVPCFVLAVNCKSTRNCQCWQTQNLLQTN